MKFKLKGVQKLVSTLQGVKPKVFAQLTDAAIAEAEAIRDEARRRVPVRYGILRDSLEVQAQPAPNNKVVITVGTDVEYAPYVHENLEARHEVGDAKFLEGPLDEAASGMLRRIGSRIDLKKAVR